MADMIASEIRRHCAALEKCNQRGGRMLSIFDLIEAGTVDLELAAFMMSRIVQGASFFVGARPGGAGKTTVMCALLNLIPAGCEIVAATPAQVREVEGRDAAERKCYVCHEIGAGPYFAYLWNGDLVSYCSLGSRGQILATNLHADDLDEARQQICVTNGVPVSDFQRFGFAVFLRVRGALRWIEDVYVSDGMSPHCLAFDRRSGLIARRISEGPYSHALCLDFLQETLRKGVRTMEETRREVLEFMLRRVSR